VSFKIIMMASVTRLYFTTPDLQDQDHRVQDEDQFFGSQTSLSLRPTVSDHITGI